MMEKNTQWNIWLIVLAILGVLVMHNYVVQWQQVEPMPYSDFLNELKNQNVKEIAVYVDHIEGSLNQPLADGRSRFSTTRVELDLARDLAQYGVRFTGVIQSTFLRDLIESAFQRATALLTQRRSVLEEGSQRLLARETLVEAEILQLVQAAGGQTG